MLGLVARSDWFLSHHGAGLEMIGRLDDYTAGSVSSLPLNSPGFLPPPSEGGGGGSTTLALILARVRPILCRVGRALFSVRACRIPRLIFLRVEGHCPVYSRLGEFSYIIPQNTIYVHMNENSGAYVYIDSQ